MPEAQFAPQRPSTAANEARGLGTQSVEQLSGISKLLIWTELGFKWLMVAMWKPACLLVLSDPLKTKEDISAMRNNSLFLKLAVTTAVLLLNIALAFAANEQVTKVGKKGDVTFNEPTQVGDVTIPPGHYVFQHRVSGNDHFVKFVGAKEMHHIGTVMTTPMQVGPTTTKEIKCTVEPLNQKVKQTAVYSDNSSGIRKVTRIEVAGENVAHVF